MLHESMLGDADRGTRSLRRLLLDSRLSPPPPPPLVPDARGVALTTLLPIPGKTPPPPYVVAQKRSEHATVC